MDFEEFCAAATSTYQLEALDGWEDIACAAFEHFESEGNRVISIEELARVSSLISLPNITMYALFSGLIRTYCFAALWFFKILLIWPQELNLGPSAYSVLRDWIRNTDGKLSLLGYTKFLHGVTLRSSLPRPR